MQTYSTQGIKLPKLGLGTYQLRGAECTAAVESALGLGYSHIDTAEMYSNEAEIGAALANSGVNRGEARGKLHLTTKVWSDHYQPKALRQALETSLHKLRVDYVDMYLLHWPAPGMNLGELLANLMQFRAEGLIKSLGVCNFTLALLRECIEQHRAPIACNQIEYHLLLDQSRIRDYLAQHHIPLVAYCPLGQGNLAHYPQLSAIARKHQATEAQIALAWLLQQDNVCAIPKSGSRLRQLENLAALKIQLDSEDLAQIAALPKDQRIVNPSFAPQWN